MIVRSQTELNRLIAKSENTAGFTELVFQYPEPRIPPEIASLTELRMIDLSKCRLADFPVALLALTQLRQLNLSFNDITVLPDAIAELTELTQFNIARNKLTSIPDSIGKLQKLEQLQLSDNQLTQLPESIAELANLEVLDVRFNQLSTLPDNITQLKKLQKLYLNNNQFKTIPESLQEITSLRSVYIANNPLNRTAAAYDYLDYLRDDSGPGHDSISWIMQRIGRYPDTLLPSEKILRRITLEIISAGLETDRLYRRLLYIRALHPLLDFINPEIIADALPGNYPTQSVWRLLQHPKIGIREIAKIILYRRLRNPLIENPPKSLRIAGQLQQISEQKLINELEVRKVDTQKLSSSSLCIIADLPGEQLAQMILQGTTMALEVHLIEWLHKTGNYYLQGDSDPNSYDLNALKELFSARAKTEDIRLGFKLIAAAGLPTPAESLLAKIATYHSDYSIREEAIRLLKFFLPFEKQLYILPLIRQEVATDDDLVPSEADPNHWIQQLVSYAPWMRNSEDDGYEE